MPCDLSQEGEFKAEHEIWMQGRARVEVGPKGNDVVCAPWEVVRPMAASALSSQTIFGTLRRSGGGEGGAPGDRAVRRSRQRLHRPCEASWLLG